MYLYMCRLQLYKNIFRTVNLSLIDHKVISVKAVYIRFILLLSRFAINVVRVTRALGE